MDRAEPLNMGSIATIPTPKDFALARDLCSYGYFLLAPNHWDVRKSVFVRTFLVGGVATTVRTTQGKVGAPLKARADVALNAVQREELIAQIRRMLRLDETADEIRAFHAADLRWKESGRGRLMRSPTLFEDIIKTVTSCNVTWPSTIVMNRRLCEVLGKKSASGGYAFVEPAKLAKARPQTLRARCRVGYRDQRLIELARLYVAAEKARTRDAAELMKQKRAIPSDVATKEEERRGRRVEKTPPRINLPWLEDPATPDDAVFKALVALPGIGPYAAANIMQLMGRYARLPLDTESVRHGKTLLGFKGSSAQIMKKVHLHYAPFGSNAFRSYWLEMWAFYESKHGPAWTWERDSTGKMFTAAQLAK